MNFCFGAVSKNVVDTIIQFSLDNPTKNVILIPSRRQIESNGGYSNNWTTKDFAQYVKSKNPAILLQRDHGGPGQGSLFDEGFVSLAEDCNHMDIIHIDPWKQYPNLAEGIQKTVEMIQFCHNKNPNVFYEIATEEAIRPFTVDELEVLITTLKSELTSDQFSKIKFLVIQCGTKLLQGKNVGTYNSNQLHNMLQLAEKYSLTAKEHNGDWVSMDIITQKYKQGLRYINISPEMAEIETDVILEELHKSTYDIYEKVYTICIESQQWKKWVPYDFDWRTQKDEIIRITCHYIFSNPLFKEIKSNMQNIDEKIQQKLLVKLFQLHQLYTERTSCIFCESNNVSDILDNDKYFSTMSLALTSNTYSKYYMPYNVLRCNKCDAFQTKYLGDLSIVYGKNHLDSYGTVKANKHTQFAEFITKNTDIQGIIEVGGCSNALSDIVLELCNTEYNIIEPDFTGNPTNLNIIPDFVENVDLCAINANTIIMSDLFEHFYKPVDILKKLQSASNIKYLYLNHPDFNYCVKNNIEISLNFEHTFLIEHNFLFKLFKKYGFSLTRNYSYVNLSLFLEFKKDELFVSDEQSSKKLVRNTEIVPLIYKYINNNKLIAEKLNEYMHNSSNKSYYVWPVSIHSISLFSYGLNHSKLSGILDNSPNKIGKYLTTYGLKCLSFNDLLQTCDSNTVIFIANAGPYVKEINFLHSQATIIFVCDLV
jgi:hypothetical protein